MLATTKSLNVFTSSTSHDVAISWDDGRFIGRLPSRIVVVAATGVVIGTSTPA